MASRYTVSEALDYRLAAGQLCDKECDKSMVMLEIELSHKKTG